MTSPSYDVIVVGARCAGSPTAMLLAREGYRVCLVDRTVFPSDTVSTHLIHPPGVAALRRWGLLDRVLETGCPPIDTYAIDIGPLEIAGTPGPEDEPVAYAPRRTVLDQVLVEAAADAGAEVRQGFTVEDVVVDDGRVVGIRGHEHGGRDVTEHASVVVGADGRNSRIARAVDATPYDTLPRLQYSYYAYWSGVPLDGRFETYLRPPRGFAAWPTNDELTLIIGGRAIDDFEANQDRIRQDVEGSFLDLLDLVPEFAERVRSGTRETRFVGTAVDSFFRKPFGPGWVLVGDAGHDKDFITAQGIMDAFLDAERCAAALDAALSGDQPFEEVMRAHQQARDEARRPIHDLTADFARLQPPPPELQQLLQAARGNREAMDGFVQVLAGVTSPTEYFAEDNVRQILGVSA